MACDQVLTAQGDSCNSRRRRSRPQPDLRDRDIEVQKRSGRAPEVSRRPTRHEVADPEGPVRRTVTPSAQPQNGRRRAVGCPLRVNSEPSTLADDAKPSRNTPHGRRRLGGPAVTSRPVGRRPAARERCVERVVRSLAVADVDSVHVRAAIDDRYRFSGDGGADRGC